MDVKPSPPPTPRAVDARDDRATKPASGFGHSRRRIAIEVAIVVIGLALLVVGAFRAASAMAGTLVRFVPRSVDAALGEPAWHQLAPDERRCTAPATTAYVDALTAPLLAALPEAERGLRFAVADDPAVNAYALPGGFVTIDLGLLEAAESGEEIAGVLAHEIQHALLRHGVVRIMRSAGGRAILGLIVGWGDVGALAQHAGGLVDLRYDRGQELEADARGRALLMKAGIDPGGMARFFARLAAAGGAAAAVPTILSTHPSHEDRVAASLADARGFTPTVDLPPPPDPLPCR